LLVYILGIDRCPRKESIDSVSGGSLAGLVLATYLINEKDANIAFNYGNLLMMLREVSMVRRLG
jgi:hypothetical protein